MNKVIMEKLLKNTKVEVDFATLQHILNVDELVIYVEKFLELKAMEIDKVFYTAQIDLDIIIVDVTFGWNEDLEKFHLTINFVE
jgi:Flp pilus assembly CpaE family ATPase